MIDNSQGTVDGVIGPRAPLLCRTLTPAQIAAAIGIAGLGALPTVLNLRFPYSIVAEHTLISSLERFEPVSPEYVGALALLSNGWPVEVRTIRRGSCIGRYALSIDRSGDVVTATSHSTAKDNAEFLELEVRRADPVSILIDRLAAATHPMWPSGTPSITAPSAEMAAALDRPTAHRFRAMGATAETANELTAALGSTTVHHDFSCGSAFPVVVIESGAGRLLATTRRGDDGRVWSTLGASTASRLRAELTVLISSSQAGSGARVRS